MLNIKINLFWFVFIFTIHALGTSLILYMSSSTREGFAQLLALLYSLIYFGPLVLLTVINCLYRITKKKLIVNFSITLMILTLLSQLITPFLPMIWQFPPLLFIMSHIPLILSSLFSNLSNE